MERRGENFGTMLRNQRERRGWTQEELAEHADISARTVRALELGARKRPHPATVTALADALGLDETARGCFRDAANRPER